MATVKIRYLTTRKLKCGRPRYYWQPDDALRQAGWKLRRLSDVLPEAMAEAQAVNEAVDQWRADLIDGPVNEKQGSVDALIAAYKKSRDFTKLADRTRKDYEHYLRAVSEWAGDEPAMSITAKSVSNLYETQRGKSHRKADYLIQVLRLLFSYAERQSIIPKGSNPATRMRLDYKAEKGNIWSPEEIKHFVDVADRNGDFAIGTAVMLNEWLGQRPGDMLTLSMNVYRNGALHVRQHKTGAEVALPVDMVPELKARLDLQISLNKKRATPGLVMIQKRNGKPYSADGFGTIFERVRDEAAKDMPSIKKLVFKNLRHTAVTRLAEAGAEIPMIAAVTGHSLKTCTDIVDRYNVRTTKMAQEAFRRRINANTGE
ncbi:MAG: hypothetical protein DI551_00605 [Micavibrio aeruginosavorus]|uniref:Phage integrase family protein n=1 Tax=Micavibrio aeruginosavorus TaxID=349221 RepID=A0A2W5N6Z1_9BACT|nr:MAG: hypothetical protein DI551_00605 [Micavibrio aeruginosavorus]